MQIIRKIVPAPWHGGVTNSGSTCLKRFYFFYTAPVTNFYMHTLSYLIFCIIFSVFNISDLSPHNSGICENLVWAWGVSMWVDEIRQIVDADAPNLKLKICKYFRSNWNIYDQLMFLCLFVSV